MTLVGVNLHRTDPFSDRICFKKGKEPSNGKLSNISFLPQQRHHVGASALIVACRGFAGQVGAAKTSKIGNCRDSSRVLGRGRVHRSCGLRGHRGEIHNHATFSHCLTAGRVSEMKCWEKREFEEESRIATGATLVRRQLKSRSRPARTWSTSPVWDYDWPLLRLQNAGCLPLARRHPSKR